ncbi:MAG: E3 binding domain-containing protein [Terricaulis sp.]|nr:E3 binding domain-containing protein [Terricaulis sp.]
MLGILSLVADAATARPENKAAEHQTPRSARAAYAAPPTGDGREIRLSPLVKRLISEHKLSADAITGSGRDGRITHKDVEAYLAHGAAKAPHTPIRAGQIPHDAMRKSIAAHMSRSVATAPHVTAVFEADFFCNHRASHQAQGQLRQTKRALDLFRLYRARGGGSDGSRAQCQRTLA